MAATRIYLVANAHARAPDGSELPSRLVRAPNAAQALRDAVIRVQISTT